MAFGVISDVQYADRGKLPSRQVNTLGPLVRFTMS